MGSKTETKALWNLRPWQAILVFGLLLCFVYGFGSFTFDYYAGAATAEFGVWGEVGGVGGFFTYVMGYFIALVIVLPILLIKRFGVGFAVYLPYAISGLFVEYYMDWVLVRNLVGLWGVAGWCVLGLVTGLGADMAYRYLPAQLSEKWRSIGIGLIIGISTFLSWLVALTYFYVERQTGPGSYLGIAYYGIPFLLLTSGFGGFTAYAISRRV